MKKKKDGIQIECCIFLEWFVECSLFSNAVVSFDTE